MTYTFDDSIVSDLHKDAYGYRPSNSYWKSWNEMNPSEKQAEWDHLCKVMDEEMARDEAHQTRCIEEWNQRISHMMVSYTINRATALRWDIDATDVDGDVSFYCYKQGLPYSYEQQIEKDLI